MSSFTSEEGRGDEEVPNITPEVPSPGNVDEGLTGTSTNMDTQLMDTSSMTSEKDEAPKVPETVEATPKDDSVVVSTRDEEVAALSTGADESSEEGSLLRNPFGSNMDKTERVLRMFLMLGLIPFVWIGWFIGLIYGLCTKKTKKIHHRLVWLLFFLNLFGALFFFFLLTYVFVNFIFVDEVAIVVKSEKCNALNLHLKTFGNSKKDNLMLFLFENADASWENTELFTLANKHNYSVVGVNMKSPNTEEFKHASLEHDDKYGLKKYADLVECLKLAEDKKINLVAIFSKDEADVFAPHPEKDGFNAILAINAEEVPEPLTPAVEKVGGLPHMKVASHVALFNKEITCGERKILPAVEITINGTKEYRRRYDSYEHIKTAFYANFPERPMTKPLSVATKEGFEKVTKALTEPLMDFMIYEAAIGSEGLTHDVTCKKALN